MSGFAADGRLDLLGRSVPAAFELRVHAIPAGCGHSVDRADWADVLVEVVQGMIQLELADGQRLHFDSGDVLWVQGLGVRVLRNRGPRPAVLAAIRRRPR